MSNTRFLERLLPPRDPKTVAPASWNAPRSPRRFPSWRPSRERPCLRMPLPSFPLFRGSLDLARRHMRGAPDCGSSAGRRNYCAQVNAREVERILGREGRHGKGIRRQGRSRDGRQLGNREAIAVAFQERVRPSSGSRGGRRPRESACSTSRHSLAPRRRRQFEGRQRGCSRAR